MSWAEGEKGGELQLSAGERMAQRKVEDFFERRERMNSWEGSVWET